MGRRPVEQVAALHGQQEADLAEGQRGERAPPLVDRTPAGGERLRVTGAVIPVGLRVRLW
jgi:hypothetical protein